MSGGRWTGDGMGGAWVLPWGGDGGVTGSGEAVGRGAPVAVEAAARRRGEARVEDGREREPDLARYPTHEEMTATLKGWTEAFPELLTLESLGRSAEGRDLWSVAVTDSSVGPAADKPALYMEGNIHAGEVLPSVVCLMTVWDLVSRFGRDQEVTDLLKTRAFYVRPRVAPDGAERYLTGPDRPRSAAIPWPRAERGPGLHPADVDGDGQITQMRLVDPAGEWRVSELDERLMVRRGPEEHWGTGYRLVQEGVVVGEGTADPVQAPAYWGLDFNRTFPHSWRPEHEQAGAGPYPLFPPETRATADFFLARPNIGAAVLYHTSGGFVFHLPSSRPSAPDRDGDLAGPYRELTEAFTRLTDQPAFQSFDEATETARHGSLMDWAYSQQGVYAWVPELWDVWRAAGVRQGREEPFVAPSEEEEAALLRWNDEALGGAGYVGWQPFEHPRLGPVEIGGWTAKFTHQNCPERIIPELARPHLDWSYVVARALPQLAIERTAVEGLGEGLWAVTAVVLNEGYLPTNVSRQATEVGKAEPVRVTVEGDGCAVVGGPAVRDLGHLEGSSGAVEEAWRGPVAARRRGTARFVVRAGEGAAFRVVAWSPRAGRVSRIVDLSTDAGRDAGLG